VTYPSDLMTISWFEAAVVRGRPALGVPERMTWDSFASVFWWRREGAKDGPSFATARFVPELDGRQVRRLKRNLLARTAVALDCETDKQTGEVPPALEVAAARVRAAGWAAVIYTSHNHSRAAPRYRIVLPLSEEIDHELPAPEVIAKRLDLAGGLDRSKLGAASLFYLPSCAPGQEDKHQTVVLEGNPIDAAWLREAAGALLDERQAEQERIAAAAHAEAAARREAKIAAGFNPDDSLIEKLRSRFDLNEVLLSHGYDRSGTKFRHPNSASGAFGADIKTFGGIERVFSHNGSDPLHAANLPAWCTVTALDAFDVVVILDFGGDRRRAMVELSQRFGLTKAAERKVLAGLMFKMIRHMRPQDEIETAAMAEGQRLGLPPHEVCRVAAWVAEQAITREAA